MSLRGAGGRFVSEARAGFSARLREAFETVASTALGLWMEGGLRGGVFELPVWTGRAVAYGRVRKVPVVSEGRVRFPGGVGSDPVEVFRAVTEFHEGAGRFTGNMVGEEGVLF